MKFDFDKDQIAGKRAFWLDGATLKSVKESSSMQFDANIKKCITETVYIKVRSPVKLADRHFIIERNRS